MTTPRERASRARLAASLRFISFERDAPKIEDSEYQDILKFGYQFDVIECEIPEDNDCWKGLIMYAKRKEFRLWLKRVVDVARECAEEAEYSEEELWE